MRNKFWRWVCRNLPKGQLLPWWAICLRATLFPVDYFFWKMSGGRGYQIQSDSWIIHGVTYSDHFFRYLKNADSDKVYRIHRDGDSITMEELDVAFHKERR